MIGVSRRAFGKLIGVGPSSVQRAVDNGRISTLADGSLDPVAARAQWERNTDPARRKPGGDRSGGDAYQAARTRDVILRAQERSLKMIERRKKLVPADAVRAHVLRAFDNFRQVFRGLPGRRATEIATAIGCDVAQLEAAMSKAFAAELDGLEPPVIRT